VIRAILIAATLLLASALRAQPGERPSLAQRLVKLYDFEERGENPLPVPRDWVRAQHAKDSGRTDFPISWNLPELDFDVACRGEGSVRLHARGDNSGLRLREHVIPVFPGADYAITARVMTRKMRVSRAFVAARFLDASGRPITASETRTAPIRSDDAWAQISLSLRGDFDDAAYLQIDLELMQPKHFVSPGLAADVVVWEEDRHVSAWFDDVAILQAPRIEITSNNPSNVIIAPDVPTLTAGVRDLTGQSLTARLEIRDDQGRVIDIERTTIPSGAASLELTPDLPGFGWYRAVLTLTGDSLPAGDTFLDFIYVPEDPIVGDVIEFSSVARDKPRFGAVAPWIEPAHRAQIAPLTRAMRIGWITIPIWSDTLTPKGAAKLVEDLVPQVDALLRAGTEVSFALERTPSTIASSGSRTGSTGSAGDSSGSALAVDPATAIALEDRSYQPLLLPILDRFGQIVTRWQFGRIGDDTRHYTGGGATLRTARGRLAGLVPDPKIEISWSALYPLRRETREPAINGYRVVIPFATNPTHIDKQVRNLLDQAREQAPSARVTLVMETLPRDRFAPRDIAVDFVKRGVLAWSVAGDHRSAPFFAIDHPWTSEGEPRPSIMPGPQLAAYRHLIERIADRRVVGELELDPDLRLLILGPSASAPPERGGALVAWSSGAGAEPKEILLATGGAMITLYDVYGNETTLQAGEQPGPARLADAGGASPIAGPQQTRVTVSTEPVFIEGIDVELLRFLSSMRLDPPFLASTVVQHDGAIELFNPWDVAVTGRLAIMEPGGFIPGVGRDDSWRFQPRAFGFDIPAGESRRFPIGIEFTVSQEAGRERLLVDLAFEARRAYRLTHEIPFEVGVKELSVEVSHRWVDGGDTLVVETTCQNRSDTDKTLEIAAFAPGVGRRSASIGRLPPGERVERQFSYSKARSLIGKSLAIMVTDAETGDRVNKAVEVR
jgi:hypothetical protein